MVYVVIWLVIGFVSIVGQYCLYRIDTEGVIHDDKTGGLILVFLLGTLGGLVTTVFTFMVVVSIIIRDFKSS